ncbi:MAG: glutamate synthase domain-containing protein 2 [Candidatus Binatia bacterium]|jgi:glutamate synthase domain-containing protein 2
MLFCGATKLPADTLRVTTPAMLIVWIVVGIFVFLLLVAIYDVCQRKHAILRNFPIVGHFRYILEAIGPEIRQYIVTDNDSERPFSRDQRRWVYATSKKQNSYFGFGTDNDLENAHDYLIIKQSAFPLAEPLPGQPGYDPEYKLPCAKKLGGYRRRKKAFRPASIVNVSAMSFGSLSSAATEAINSGCAIAGCLHNTGEGGIAPYHQKGGDLIWQIGTGYFGCREKDGSFSRERLRDTIQANPQIRALEIKLSQGAKAGLGGMVPGKKVTPEIAAIRGIPAGKDCISPPKHSTFHDVDSMLDWVEGLAEETGLPVGIKSAVGEAGFWEELALKIDTTNRAVDYIAIDGGEGGTGAAPLVFSDHVALPFKHAFTRVYSCFAERGIHEKIVFVGSGKLGFPETALFAFGLGCDMVAVGREPMMAIGCIQAQRCHTGHCPTGVATHNKWLVRGLDPTSKSARLANYVIALRKELLKLSHACGAQHPAMVTPDHFEILDGPYSSTNVRELFKYNEAHGLPSDDDQTKIIRLMDVKKDE